MDKDKVVLGMKVVPHSKTATAHHTNSFKSSAQTLEGSGQWQEAKKLKQPYLYVAHQHTDDKQHNTGRYLLNYENTWGLGDYFMASDFEPFIESEETI